MTRYALATDLRHRLVTRPHRPPATISPGLIATAWNPAGEWWWRPAQAQWNGLRWLIGHVWPPQWHGHHHPLLWRLARLAWGVTAYVAFSVAAFNAMILTALWPLWIALAHAAGSGLVLAGWTPPLAAVDIPAPETATLREPPAPTTPTAADTTEWDWNDRHDPYVALHREAVAELRRSNDLTAAQSQHPTANPVPIPPPVVAYQRPQGPTQPAARLPRSRGRWTPALGLLWISIVMGAVFTIAAWVLAWLSALGVIGAPPALDPHSQDLTTVTTTTVVDDPQATEVTP